MHTQDLVKKWGHLFEILNSTWETYKKLLCTGKGWSQDVDPQFFLGGETNQGPDFSLEKISNTVVHQLDCEGDFI